MESINEHPDAPKIVPQTITLADGTILNGSGALNTYTDDLWLRIWQKMSIGELSLLLEDQEKTTAIKIIYSEMESNIFHDYTVLNYIMLDSKTGEIRARLKKPT